VSAQPAERAGPVDEPPEPPGPPAAGPPAAGPPTGAADPPADVEGTAGAEGESADGAEADEPEPAAPTPRRRRFGWMLAPLGIYAATRLVQLWLIEWMLGPAPAGPFAAPANPMRDKLLSWDAALLVRVAVDGYPRSYQYGPDGKLLGSTLAFFPGYPLLIRLGHTVTRVDAATVAVAIAWICAGVLAVLVCALGTALWDRRTGLVLTTLLCAQPMSVVFSMGYTEPVFMMFATGALLAAYRHRWLLAGVLGLAAGLTRPTGAAVALAILVAAVVHVSRREHGRRRWWALAGAGLAAIGVPAYLIWVGLRLGEPAAWFKVQAAGWGTSFDQGAMVLRFVRDALRSGDGWVHVSVAWLLIAAVASALLAVWLAIEGRVWPPLVVYGLVALVLVVGQAGYYHSKPRLLVPVLVTLVPAALALGRARPRTAVAVLVGFGLFGLWYGAYMITVWRYAI
jgi:hypothetical protein